MRRLLSVSNWLKSPNDRDIIARWTPPPPAGGAPADAAAFTLALPPEAGDAAPADAWEFLAVGDTGDADAAGPKDSPQDAVGREMGRDAAAPVGSGAGRLVVHTGDVIYMTGERRLYDRNFRRPYGPFLTGESTVDDLVFRLPFLPVPGNHDYYDLGSWASWLSRVPLLGSGLRALAHEIFAFGLPEGGSDMGRAYMEAFVARDRDAAAAAGGPMAYVPGKTTRLPNRYYQFRAGNVDFFALDSNTLDAPPPEDVDLAQVRLDAAARIETLDRRADALDRALRREQRARDEQHAALRRSIGAEPQRRAALGEQAGTVARYLAGLGDTLEGLRSAGLAGRARVTARSWDDGAGYLAQADTAEEAEDALRHLDEASDETCALLSEAEYVLADLEKGDPLRTGLLAARDAVEKSQSEWAEATSLRTGIEERIRALSEEALDVQRDLAQAKRARRYHAADHDRAQLEWLDAAMTASERERPEAWRIVYLHHPPYSSISNRCERADIQGVRANLFPVLQRHDVHVVLGGHSHAFEWIRSSALPNVGFFVTGGGGQISLRPSLFEPRRLPRLRHYYDLLRAAGAEEVVMAGHGPAAPGDGVDGLLYHYVRVEVTPNALTFRPVGVRRLSDDTYRREEPLPVFHAPTLPASRPRWQVRTLAGVVVRRGAPPRPVWA